MLGERKDDKERVVRLFMAIEWCVISLKRHSSIVSVQDEEVRSTPCPRSVGGGGGEVYQDSQTREMISNETGSTHCVA